MAALDALSGYTAHSTVRYDASIPQRYLPTKEDSFCIASHKSNDPESLLLVNNGIL